MILGREEDTQDAILTIHPGAGGTESQDWVQMLYRMYSRWAEKKGYNISVIDFQAGDEAGFKDVTFIVEGILHSLLFMFILQLMRLSK